MTPNEYQKYIVDRFTNPNVGDHIRESFEVGVSLDDNLRVLQSCFGLMGEGGELIDLIKKVIFHNIPVTPELTEKIKLELGDVGFYWYDLCHRLGFTAEEIMAGNIAKLDARYPNGFNTIDSIKRKDENGGK